MNEDLLMKYFDFNEADLYTNRNGALSPRQKKRLEDSDQSWNKLILYFGIFLLVVAIVPGLIFGISALPCISTLCSKWPQSLRIFSIAFSLIWMLVSGFIGILVILKRKMGNKTYILKQVEGPVNIVMDKSYNSTSKRYVTNYELHIGGITFNANSELADVIMQGDIYMIYYIDKLMEIISAQLVQKGK